MLGFNIEEIENNKILRFLWIDFRKYLYVMNEILVIDSLRFARKGNNIPHKNLGEKAEQAKN